MIGKCPEFIRRAVVLKIFGEFFQTPEIHITTHIIIQPMLISFHYKIEAINILYKRII